MIDIYKFRKPYVETTLVDKYLLSQYGIKKRNPDTWWACRKGIPERSRAATQQKGDTAKVIHRSGCWT